MTANHHPWGSGGPASTYLRFCLPNGWLPRGASSRISTPAEEVRYIPIRTWQWKPCTQDAPALHLLVTSTTREQPLPGLLGL